MHCCRPCKYIRSTLIEQLLQDQEFNSIAEYEEVVFGTDENNVKTPVPEKYAFVKGGPWFALEVGEKIIDLGTCRYHRTVEAVNKLVREHITVYQNEKLQ